MKAILVATDFTPESKNAARYAAQLALATGGRIILLHTTQFSIVNDSLLTMKKAVNRMADEGEKQMIRLEKELRTKFPGLKIETKIREGFTPDIIRDEVDGGKISMVAMSIQSTDKLYNAIFGSTSSNIAGSLHCPVLIVPANSRFRSLKKIAFAFDQKEIPLDTGISVLAELKKAYSSSMRYINIMDGPVPLNDDSTLKPVYKILNDKEPKIQYFQKGARTVSELLTVYIRSYKPNMMVMVSRKHSLFSKIFKTRNTKSLAFNTVVPLLVLSESSNN